MSDRIPIELKTYRPSRTGKHILGRVNRRLLYRCDGDEIAVLYWHRWPSYDFIFGVPTKKNRYHRKEAGFFQYRDVRAKKVVCGFYVDKRELKILARGFKGMMEHGAG